MSIAPFTKDFWAGKFVSEAKRMVLGNRLDKMRFHSKYQLKLHLEQTADRLYG